ncbi:MAG: hypothetical protein J7K21_06140 [Desulfurococcales archaeon]|nr:hypothetical protein [Desulfurococcales archaeon]
MNNTRYNVLNKLLRRLEKKGIKRRYIEALLSGEFVKDEYVSWIVIEEARKLDPEIVLEDEIGGIDVEPVYVLLLKIEDILIGYCAAPNKHQVKIYDKVRKQQAINELTSFLEEYSL